LIDDSGKTVFTGKAELAKPDGALEQICIHEKQDYTKSVVYRMDFSAFDKPGQYRVFVPGIGTSGPLRIAEDAWEAPFKAAMQGILSQRQGVELGPPVCAFRRKRTFHPDDGVVFYQLDVPIQAGERGQGPKGLENACEDSLVRLSKAGALKPTTVVPGGYQDAGDWITASHHLSATYDLLGLYDLNPEAFTHMKLVLPPEEGFDKLPDILKEALWQMPMWKSLQLPDGGVRGGYVPGYVGYCYTGETSDMIKNALVYSVDHETTIRYAASAARAARVLAAFDKRLSADYMESAKRAWDWVEAHSKEDDEFFKQVLKFNKNLASSLRNPRAMAAVELLAATKDPAYDAAFKQSTELTKDELYMAQPDTDYAYARLPDGVGDPELKRKAANRIVTYADHAIAFSRNNAFDVVASGRTDFPLIGPCHFFSTPAQGGPGQGGFTMIHAYELTKNPIYLAAAVQGSNYCLGSNPDNLSYCTGVGYNYQHFQFRLDALTTGQMPDILVGHIPYGQGNEGGPMSRDQQWTQKWLLNYNGFKKMIPNWYDWPVNEQYIDYGVYPMQNENCFNQTMAPAACYWFYLHTRWAGGKIR